MNSTFLISGFGRTSTGANSIGQGGSPAPRLQYGLVKYSQPQAQCAIKLGPGEFNEKTMIW